MEPSHFDRLTRSLGPRLTRRKALAGAAGMAAIGLSQSAPGLSAQDATPAASPVAGEPKLAFLFVQLFDQGSWAPKPGEDGVYLLTLTGASAQTLYFSDRPARIVGTVDTVQFLDTLGFTPINPPNAALVVRTPEGERDVLVIELFDPVYTEDFAVAGAVQVVYKTRVLEAYHGDGLEEWAAEQADTELPEQFSDVSLFIDDCPDLTSCYKNHYSNRIGDLPGGARGQCWNFFNGCEPYNPNCNGPERRELGLLCNQTYEDCQDQCFAGT